MRTHVLRTWTAGIGLAMLASANGIAQQSPAAAKSKAGVVATVSATGCVEKWTPQPGDATAKAPDGVQYVLTQIEGRTASATSADPGTPERTPPAARYLLLSQPSLNVGAHLNHRVRIDGTIAPQPTEGATLPDHLVNPATRETNLPEGPESKSYRDNLVEVSSLSMVASSCSK